MTNLLAGAVEQHLGRDVGSVSNSSLELKRTASDLNIEVGGGLLADPIPMFRQFVNTDPPVVTNVDSGALS